MHMICYRLGSHACPLADQGAVHEHSVVDTASPRRASFCFLWRHESLSLRQSQQRRPSFGALPRPLWTALGILELLGAVVLILPGVLHSHTDLIIVAAAVLCGESLLFIWVHMKYAEKTPIIMSAVLGVVMAFIAYGRFALAAL